MMEFPRNSRLKITVYGSFEDTGQIKIDGFTADDIRYISASDEFGPHISLMGGDWVIFKPSSFVGRWCKLYAESPGVWDLPLFDFVNDMIASAKEGFANV